MIYVAAIFICAFWAVIFGFVFAQFEDDTNEFANLSEDAEDYMNTEG